MPIAGREAIEDLVLVADVMDDEIPVVLFDEVVLPGMWLQAGHTMAKTRRIMIIGNSLLFNESMTS